MPNQPGRTGALSLLQRAASSLANALTRRASKKQARADATASERGSAPSQPRRTRREPDIPLDQLAATYTPTQTSLKGPFRASGRDRQNDQEFATGAGDGPWNDEDHYTNKSGDPRIGTHGRTYEPGESNR